MAMNLTDTELQNIVDKMNQDEVIRLIPLLIFLLLISVIGIPGNLLVCYIYWTKYTMSSYKLFIVLIGLADIFMCVINVPLEFATSLYQFYFKNSFGCQLRVFLNNWSLLTQGFILVIVAVDRYRMVCKSQGWQIHLKTAKIVSTVAVFAGLILSIPLWWIYGIYKYKLTGQDFVLSACSFHASSISSSSAFYYMMSGMVIFVSLLSVICILYCFVGRKIKLQSQFRNNCNRSNKTAEPISISCVTDRNTYNSEMNNLPKRHQEITETTQIKTARVRNATLGMFLISLAFILTYLPLILLLLIRTVIQDFEAGLNELERAVYKFFLRSYFLNCSINPFIYGLSDSKFKQYCKDVFSKLCCTLKSS